MMATPKNKPHPLDVHVGSRVKLRRRLCAVTQEALAERLGVTFQQVQKYEKGTNRISASRLFLIAETLGCRVQFFFDELEGSPFNNYEQRPDSIQSFLKSSEAIQLNLTFPKIKDEQVRDNLLNLVKVMADAEKLEEQTSVNDV